MTNKIYKTAQGQTVDLGALVLKNETVRAVGNMNVNARGDLLDGSNRVIDQRNQQVARQLESTTQPAPIPVSTKPLHTSTVAARRSRETAETVPEAQEQTVATSTQTDAVADSIPADETPLTGLAAAIARSKLDKSNPGDNNQ
jgi:hypothetical protein